MTHSPDASPSGGGWRIGSAVALVFALCGFAAALALTYVAWQSADAQRRKDLQTEFDYLVRTSVRRVELRMGIYEQVERATSAFLLGTPDVEPDKLAYYVSALELERNYPGIQGIAIVKRIPVGARAAHEAAMRKRFPDYTVHPANPDETISTITHIEPLTPMNRRAIGFDMLTEPLRRAAMERARDTGRASASGKVRLIQENGKDAQAGLVMYVPVYERGLPTETVEQRRAAITGWVGAPFRMRDLMNGISEERAQEFALAIYDAGQETPDALLYSSDTAGGPAPHARLEARRTIEVGGRPWLLRYHSTQQLEARLATPTARYVALGGAGTSLLLGLLVWVIASDGHRTRKRAREMTAQLRTSNAQLAAEQQRIHVLLDTAYDAFIATDAQGIVTDWNNKAARMFGYSASEAIGQDMADLIVPPEMRTAHRAGMARYIQTGQAKLVGTVVETVAQRRDGSVFPVELALAGVGSEERTGVSAFIRDITERNENRRREAARNEALEQARNELHHAQKLEAIGKLTGGVAHDFNNVLQVIGGNAQLLQLSVRRDDAKLQQWIASIQASVERGSKLSSQLLSFARRQPLQPVAVDPARIVRGMEDLLQRALGESIRFEVVEERPLSRVKVDPGQLENVLINLVINARDAMPQGGTLRIAMRDVALSEAEAGAELAPGPYVLLEISDTGAGMPEDVRARAFEPFFTTKEVGKGTGLGLSMAYGFVRQSGGRIELHSEPGQGTLVKIYLPASDEAEAMPDRRVARTESRAAGTILVVDDDPNVRDVTVAMITGLGYEVIEAEHAAQALALLQAGCQPDLIFTDVVMPGPMSSTDLARRAAELLPGVPVLFTSGYTRDELSKDGKLMEGVQLLPKPYTRAELASQLGGLLGATSA
ncbi:PAS domain S-box protein [Massilia arenosa]|uniref:histidine kinase n=1 Tax=Zemynaea arenosa TaxID=2561931 RepID=A0A4Y9SN94_9BURK|nr:CHASE domain-containing protein [Massilia arenosa]TFW24497.1 PAS domain S-box protein [Massilia arenosa]